MKKTHTIIEVKQALADKYAHLARIANSEPKRRQLAYRAGRYTRQVEQLSRNK